MTCRNCKNLTHLYEDGEPYDWCEKVMDSPYIDRERDCKHYEAATRADKVRAMTDEELARFTAMLLTSVPEIEESIGYEKAEQFMLEWMKKVDET